MIPTRVIKLKNLKGYIDWTWAGTLSVYSGKVFYKDIQDKGLLAYPVKNVFFTGMNTYYINWTLTLSAY